MGDWAFIIIRIALILHDTLCCNCALYIIVIHVLHLYYDDYDCAVNKFIVQWLVSKVSSLLVLRFNNPSSCPDFYAKKDTTIQKIVTKTACYMQHSNI